MADNNKHDNAPFPLAFEQPYMVEFGADLDSSFELFLLNEGDEKKITEKPFAGTSLIIKHRQVQAD
jgi:hypothetical protein